jgi:hypothetical protein
MSRTKRPLRVTDSNQVCFGELATRGLEEELLIFPKSCRYEGQLNAFTYKSLLGTISKGRRLRVESEHNATLSPTYRVGLKPKVSLRNLEMSPFLLRSSPARGAAKG